MSNPSIGFYPTTQLNPYTTTIGSEGTFQSIMSYIYGASSYESMQSATVTTSSTSETYSGIYMTFTPTNSLNTLISYDIYSGNNSATVSLNTYLYIDTVAGGQSIIIDNGNIPVDSYRTQKLIIIDGILYGGNNSGTSVNLTLNTKYYLSWYYSSGSAATTTLAVLGFSIQSI